MSQSVAVSSNTNSDAFTFHKIFSHSFKVAKTIKMIKTLFRIKDEKLKDHVMQHAFTYLKWCFESVIKLGVHQKIFILKNSYISLNLSEQMRGRQATNFSFCYKEFELHYLYVCIKTHHSLYRKILSDSCSSFWMNFDLPQNLRLELKRDCQSAINISFTNQENTNHDFSLIWVCINKLNSFETPFQVFR